MVLQKHKKIKTRGMVRAKNVGSVIADILIMVAVGLLAFLCILPMWHVLMSSLSDGFSIYSFEGIALIPQGGLTFQAYAELFTFRDGLIWRGYMNTIIYVVGCVGLGLVLNVLGGYCLSRKTKLGGFLSFLCVFSIMFSGGQGPLYWIVDTLGLTKTYFSVILTECTLGMYIILGRIAFAGVPSETVESAQLDGAGHLCLMFRIMLPQCLSLFMVTVLFSFVTSWNSFVGVQLYNSGADELYSLQLILQIIKETVDGWMSSGTEIPYERYPMQFAGVVVATLPIMLMMPFFQKQIESGVISGAVKG